MKTSLTDATKLSEQLTVANDELTRLRAQQRRAARAASGTWATPRASCPPRTRSRIANNHQLRPQHLPIDTKGITRAIAAQRAKLDEAAAAEWMVATAAPANQ